MTNINEQNKISVGFTEQIEAEKVQAFTLAYKELCDKYGYEIAAQPVWVGTNHGSFELSINVFVSKLLPR
ncbi:MAG: hypothetical protein WC479_04450 [Candidatus Izemoplasmatales bacterium]